MLENQLKVLAKMEHNVPAAGVKNQWPARKPLVPKAMFRWGRYINHGDP
jgi:hypothetical protein